MSDVMLLFENPIRKKKTIKKSKSGGKKVAKKKAKKRVVKKKSYKKVAKKKVAKKKVAKKKVAKKAVKKKAVKRKAVKRKVVKKRPVKKASSRKASSRKKTVRRKKRKQNPQTVTVRDAKTGRKKSQFTAPTTKEVIQQMEQIKHLANQVHDLGVIVENSQSKRATKNAKPEDRVELLAKQNDLVKSQELLKKAKSNLELQKKAVAKVLALKKDPSVKLELQEIGVQITEVQKAIARAKKGNRSTKSGGSQVAKKKGKRKLPKIQGTSTVVKYRRRKAKGTMSKKRAAAKVSQHIMARKKTKKAIHANPVGSGFMSGMEVPKIFAGASSRAQSLAQNYLLHDVSEAAGLLIGGLGTTIVPRLIQRFSMGSTYFSKLASWLEGRAGVYSGSAMSLILGVGLGYANNYVRNSQLEMLAKGMIGASVVGFGITSGDILGEKIMPQAPAMGRYFKGFKRDNFEGYSRKQLGAPTTRSQFEGSMGAPIVRDNFEGFKDEGFEGLGGDNEYCDM